MSVEKLLEQSRELERAKIIGETARIPWRDLQRFFAAGKLLWIDSELDLVDIAYAVQQDDVTQIEALTGSGQIAVVSDDQARGWYHSDAELWAVVVKPWVLVQERPDHLETAPQSDKDT